MNLKTFKKLTLMVLILLSGCASQNDKEKEKGFEVDQEIIDGNGIVSFARAHYLIAKTDAMNRVFENKMIEHINEYCEKKKMKKQILRKYSTQTDFVTLRFDYKYNRKVKVYEFQCIR